MVVGFISLLDINFIGNIVRKEMKKKYRIVTDKYAGYEVQVKTWYWPFWVELGINTFTSIEHARAFIRKMRFKSEVVWSE